MTSNETTIQTQISALKKQRRLLKTQLTKFENSINSQAPNINNLNVRLPRIKSSLDEFLKIQFDLEILENIDAQDDIRDEFEDHYYRIITRVDEIILASNSNNTTNLPTNNSGNISNNNLNNHVRLPKIDLPIFFGDYQDWYSFHDTFHSLIHGNPDLSNIQKFHYLKASLKGEAAEVLHSLEISSINYAEAWSLLTERYDHKRLIIQTHIKAIDNLPCALKENAGTLRKILDGSLKHVRALKALERPVEYWDDLLVHLITKKLDPITNKEWEQKLSRSDIPTYKDITDFLMQRCHTLEAILKSNSTLTGEIHPVKRKNIISHVTTGPATCPICNKNNHLIYQCKEFLDLPIKQRLQRAKSKNLCVNCLRGNHQVNKCHSSACRTCNKRHNTLLHFEEEPKPSTSSSTFVTHSSATNQISQTFLSTAIINVFDKNHKIQKCRALLDSGSQSNFITKALAEKLGLKQNNIHQPVIGINNSFAKVNKMLSIKLSSRYNAFQANLDCLVIENISQNLPQLSIHKSSIVIPDNIKLADPEFHISRKIDMLIGSDLFWKLLCVGQIKISPRQPYLQKTLLGWIVAGRYSANNPALQNTLCNLSTQVLQSQLTKFWELEECPQIKPLTVQERQCERVFVNTYTRNQQGRFIVHLPLKMNASQLGESKNAALKRLYSLENKLDRQPQLREEYNKFMSEYIGLGHVKLLPSASVSTNEPSFYLPHHAVFKNTSTTTKLRVVFDGSAKTSNGISLNDLMLVGPTIQDDLLTIITRFRNYQYVVTADICKMYRQILESQTPLQRILWRFSANQPIQTYELQTVTYGTTSASYLAIKSLHQLAHDEGTLYPVGASTARRDFYVDDLLTGANTVHEVKTIIHEVSNLLSKGGFELRKWSTNHPFLLKDIPETSKESAIVNLNKEPITHALGLQWNSQTDTLQYAISSATTTSKITKRSILSKTAQIFDPLGLIAPVIIRAKIIMQELWLLNIDWDESVPTQVHSAWEEFEREFVLLNEIRIPRQATIQNNSSPIEICGFCDASERAYGACIYLRTINSQGYIESKLLCAKSRVAPTKNISLPRLELCGALLLARLVDKISRALSTYEKEFYLWSDSTIVLSWIRSSARNWKTFVANRVGEIQTLTTSNNWNHVSTSENPADIISRGMLPSLLIKNKLWWKGPEWLTQPKAFWPEQTSDLQSVEEIEEYRPPMITLISTNHLVTNLIDRYSNFQKLIRVSAYCYRFGWNLLCRIRHNKAGVLVGPIKSSEVSFVTKIFIKEVQESAFSKELLNLKRNAEIPCNSSLRCLNPFLDADNIIRVGGRLKNSQLTYDKKHPIVLPSNHNFSKLLASYEHRRQLHAGPLATLAAIRAKYWPLSGRSLVRDVIHKCITCFKARPPQLHQLMGNLPLNRVAPARPFINSGVDYCGPLQVREGALRRMKTTKAYVAIFVCFATKAVHIELVSNLSTEAFINALKRFMSRRGKVSNLYSDNGTNFVGANRELKVLNDLFKSENQHKIIEVLAEDNINWSFIPPRSPHFGGLWEAAVKSAKHHIKRVLGDTVLNFEELYTLLTQIEAILNSRPITPLSNDPTDLSFLCPGHFLIGDSLTSTVEPDLSHIKLNRLSRWQHVEYMKQHFWKRWSKEYLSQIQERTKWKNQGGVQIQVGQLALIREDDVPSFKWVTGRIEMLHPGSDGVARVATLRTSKDTIKRAVHRLCILPIEVTGQGI